MRRRWSMETLLGQRFTDVHYLRSSVRFGIRWCAARTTAAQMAQRWTWSRGKQRTKQSSVIESWDDQPGHLPECVAVALVIYLELGLCLLLLSNQFNTSRTAWGFFFCSCLLILEFISNRAHASGIPCKNITVHINNRKLKNQSPYFDTFQSRLSWQWLDHLQNRTKL